MAPPLLILKDIHLTFGGHPLLEGAELSIAEGARLCLVGRNGSGKSTLLKIAAGALQPDTGERSLRQGTSIQYLPQEPDLTGYETTLAYASASLPEDEDPYRARYLLEQLGLVGDEAPQRLSGGEIRRAALARVLAAAPDILMLDEPTNHLDLVAIEWLEQELARMSSAMVMISHDRRFLSTLSRSTVWLDRGITRHLDRGFAEFEAWRDQVLEEEEMAAHKLDRKIVAEEHWMRYGVTARRKRNQRRVAGLQGLRQERRELRRAVGTVKMTATESEMSPKLAIEAIGVAKSYGDRAIVENFSLRILRGDRIGVIGPNGAGKTTLLNLLTGKLAPDAGAVKLGANLDIVVIDQKRESLDGKMTLREAMVTGHSDTVIVGGKPRHVMGYLKDFLFSPDQAGTPVEALSGGERARVILARTLARPANLLVLDEPTNDLDLETLDLLQEMLADYEGTVLLVSHDRDFLDRVATAVVVSEGQGQWTVYAGGYSDMLAQRGSSPVTPARGQARLRTAGSTNGTQRADSKKTQRLGFKEKHALETLPKRINDLQAEIARQQTVLDDPTLYGRDSEAFAAASAKLTKAQLALSAAEEEWLTLEMLREDVEKDRTRPGGA